MSNIPEYSLRIYIPIDNRNNKLYFNKHNIDNNTE